MGAQKKTEAEVVAIIMDQIPTEYKVVMSALKAKPVEERTLDLVRMVYWEYWDANLKGMEEQPSESDGNVDLDTDKRDKNGGDAFFVGMSINEEHEMAITNAKVFSKNQEGSTGAVLADDEVQLFQHRMWSQQQKHEEFLRRREAKIIQEMF